MYHNAPIRVWVKKHCIEICNISILWSCSHWYYITFNFQPPAPEELLTIIRCKCKNCTRNQCGTNICSCKRNGLSCLAACGECRGVCCYNSATVEEEEVKENEREMDERNLYDTLFTWTKSIYFVENLCKM